MTTVFCRFAKLGGLCACLVLPGVAGAQGKGSSPPPDWNLAVIDRILAGVQPGQTLVPVGDMQILVRNLTAWRNQMAGTPEPQSTFSSTVPLWTGGNVYYTFDGTVSVAKQKVARDSMSEWETFANLHFIPRTVQANYFTIQENPSLGGGQSAVGMTGGQQFLQIGPSAWNHGTLCHELGHTLGMLHEQQRTNRDLFVVILTNNITPGAEGNFVKLTPANSRNVGAYDFYSVMHYSRNSFSTNPAVADTIVPLPAFAQFLNIMGQQSDPVLSPLDRAGMATNYGVGPVLSAVVTNTQDSGAGSLRAALYYAFDHQGTTISFNIPTSDPGYSNTVFNLKPTDRYPSLVNATLLDGATEPTNSNPNGPEILIDGTLTRAPSVFADGLKITGSNCVVRSLVINNFPGAGVVIDGTNATGNVVSGCYLGINPSGTAAVPNGLPAATISGGARGNTLGGTNAAARNVISGSSFQGLTIRDPGTRNNTVQGNYIGLNAAGTAALPNSRAGIDIFGGAQSNIIGGSVSGAGNVISGNTLQGLVISDSNAIGHVISGNYVGLNAAGTAAIPNGWAGVELHAGVKATLIGGSTVAARNVISGNNLQGVAISGADTSGNVATGNYIGLNAPGTAPIGNGQSGLQLFDGAHAIVIGGYSASERNVVSGNTLQAIAITGTNTQGNFVVGNYLGLNPAGTAAIGNGWGGVDFFDGTCSNTVGGTVAGARNIISGNGTQGIVAGGRAKANTIQGNYIGLNAAGTAAVPNNWAGVQLADGAISNLVGGLSVAARNVISGNNNQGVSIGGSNAFGNVIEGNYIGCDVTGTAAVPNLWAGVDLYGGTRSNTIGGFSLSARNVISGNASQGMLLSGIGTSNNVVRGNLIGLNAAGTAALGNSFSGIEFYDGPRANVIGGPGDARNFISGNANYGVLLSVSNTAGNFIQGNTIGLNANHNAAAPNAFAGIALFNGPQSNLIGGVTFASANIIASNLSDAIQIADPASTNNTIRGNSIFGNSGVGIGLYSSGNRLQAAPSLTTAVLGTNTIVSGNLTSLASRTFHIDFYANPAPAAGAEGMTYLGFKDVTTSAGGSVSFAAALSAVVPAGRVITATATDPAGNTSQFSGGLAVTTTTTVNDGIPDAWRAAKFGGNGTTTNSQSCATCDPDGDHMNNRQEFLAGTNPTNAASVLKLVGSSSVGAGNVASFLSSTGIVYRLETRSLVTTGAWSILADQVIGTGGSIVVTDPSSAVLPRRFYRVEVLW